MCRKPPRVARPGQSAGQILPVASVRGLMGAEESGAATTRAIVLDGAAPVALAVDLVQALVTVKPTRSRRAKPSWRRGQASG